MNQPQKIDPAHAFRLLQAKQLIESVTVECTHCRRPVQAWVEEGRGHARRNRCPHCGADLDAEK